MNDMIRLLRDYFSHKKEVSFAYLFGSFATHKNSILSDIDIAVMCEKRCSLLTIASEISELLQFEDIDVIDLKSTENLRLLKDIIKEGIVLKDSPQREDWEIANYHLALDFLNHTKVVYGY